MYIHRYALNCTQFKFKVITNKSNNRFDIDIYVHILYVCIRKFIYLFLPKQCEIESNTLLNSIQFCIYNTRCRGADAYRYDLIRNTCVSGSLCLSFRLASFIRIASVFHIIPMQEFAYTIHKWIRFAQLLQYLFGELVLPYKYSLKLSQLLILILKVSFNKKLQMNCKGIQSFWIASSLTWFVNIVWIQMGKYI